MIETKINILTFLFSKLLCALILKKKSISWKYIEKVLNCNAINVKLIDSEVLDKTFKAIIKVSFCKKISDNLIDFVNLNLLENS